MVPLNIILYSLLAVVVAYIVQQLLSKKPNPIKYNIKFYSYLITTLTICGFLVPILIFKKRSIHNALFATSCMNYAGWILGLEWVLRNKHILAEDRACVVVGNHQSILDLTGTFVVWNIMKKCLSIIKKEMFYVWPFGLVAYLSETTFLNRKNPKESYEKLDMAKEIMLKQKCKIWLFPEGTRNNTVPGMLPFKRGGFKLAIDAQVPIIPVVFSPQYFINPKKNLLDRGKVIMTCLEPIETKGLTEDDITDLIERTRNVMMECYKNVAKEVLPSLPADYPMAEGYKLL